MKKTLVLCIIVICTAAFRHAVDKTGEPKEIKTAIQKSLSVLQYSSDVFIKNAACYSCHGQCLSAVAFGLAREKGFLIEDSIYTETHGIIMDIWTDRQPKLVEHVELDGGNISTTYSLWGLFGAGVPRNKTTSLLAKQLLETQSKNGSWPGSKFRAPLEYYSFVSTALAIRGLLAYTPPGLQDRLATSKTNALAWMSKTYAANNEEKAFQLLGLQWLGADRSLINKLGRSLLANQHRDGGWSQLDSLPTDAYATGQNLYALQQSGVLKTTDEAFQKGITFLLNTQHDDGTWLVKTRSLPVVKFVDSGFPYGKDQFISAAGTNWAVMALLLAQ
jgi:hypothetical protein